MKPIKIALSVAALGATILLSPLTASAADGIAVRPSQIAEPARASILSAINAYKSAHPEAFEALKEVKGHRPEVYGQRRKPEPEVSRELRRLGPTALLPMLNALAFEAPERGKLTDREWDALTIGLLDAVGSLRDPQSAPVLRAAFESSGKSAPVLRAAALAVGRLCGDADLALLMKRSAANDPLRLPAIAGLGECRRVESAKHLAGLLASSPDDTTTQVIASALGLVASSWAWRAMGPAAEATGLTVREIAARALVDAFVQRSGEVRADLRNALLFTEHKGTVDLLAKARPAANAETAAAIDALSKRIQSSK
jgi:hypothetical protein